MAHMAAPRAKQRWPKQPKNTTTCDVPPRKAQTQNEKFLFRFWLKDLLNPSRVWTAL